VIPSLLAIGFLLGLRHALEADHIAAVTTMVTRSASLRDTLRISGAWGLGHAATITLFGAALIVLGASLPASVAGVLEAIVGVMLIVLGVDVLRRLARRQLHVPDEVQAHGHAHPHAPSLWPRALIVGCVHGLAGTAGLLLLALPSVAPGAPAVLYLVLFGVGTVAGMMLFSLVISVPLAMSVRRLRWAAYTLHAATGTINVALGVWIAIRSIM
jgi:sulfite exporter TauE/SafE